MDEYSAEPLVEEAMTKYEPLAEQSEDTKSATGAMSPFLLWSLYATMVFMSPFMFWNGVLPALWIFAVSFILFNYFCQLDECWKAALHFPTALGMIIAEWQLTGPPSFEIYVIFGSIAVMYSFYAVLKLAFWFHKRFKDQWFNLFLLPTFWCAILQFSAWTPLSSMMSTSISQVHSHLIIYWASYFGAAFLSWVPLFCANIVFMWKTNSATLKKHWWVLIIFPVLFLMALPGGEVHKYFGQNAKQEHFQISCMASNNPDSAALMEHVEAGSHLIIYPESTRPSDVNLDTKNAILVHGGHPNKITMRHKGKVLYESMKRNPVPGEQLPKSDPIPSPISTDFGYVGGAVCYDFSNAETIRKVAYGADLLVEISHTWNAFGTAIAKMDRIRAVENGVWHVKCDDYGLAMATSPYGEIIYFSGVLYNSNAKFTMPKPERQFTFFKYGGFVFPYLCVAVFSGALMAFIAILIREKYYGRESLDTQQDASE